MEIVLYCLLSYLIGSISFALIIGKTFYKIDLRTHGSGNLGATNAFRILGKKAGFVVTIGDILKGTIPTLLPFFLHLNIHPIIFGICAIIGHVFPIFSKFKGGKAVATTSGVILAYNPLAFGILVLGFLLTLFLCKMVSVSSICASILLLIISIYVKDDVFIYFSLFIVLFITLKHKSNIKRVLNKTEPKISWM